MRSRFGMAIAVAAALVAVAGQAPAGVTTVWLSIGRGSPTWPADRPPRTWVRLSKAAPAIDGKLDDKAWTRATRLVMGRLDGSARAAGRSEVLLAQDGSHLYVGFRLEEPLVRQMRRKVRGRDGNFWNDDSVEMFLSPEGGKSYFHIGIGAGGAFYDAKGKGGKGWDSRGKAAVDIQTCSWSAEFAIPFAGLVGAGAVPIGWRANFNRARFAGGMTEDLAWSPTFSNSSHVPGRFGHLLMHARPAGLIGIGPVRWWGGGITRTTTPDGTRLSFDLSAIPRGTKVYRATLRAETFAPSLPTDSRAYMKPGYYDPLRLYAQKTPRRPVEVYALAARGDADPAPGAKPLKLLGPRFRSFDVTDAVRGWIAKPRSNAGLLVKRFDYWVPDATVLEVRYEGTVKDPPPQAKGLKVVHRKGQTFITFREIDELIAAEDITWADFLRTYKRGSPRGRVLYRVYRSAKPITADNLAAAEQIDEVGPLSGYDGRIHQHTCRGENWTGLYSKNIVPRYCIADPPAGVLKANRVYEGLAARGKRPEWRGNPIPLHTGLYVHQPAKTGKAYYAVTTLVNGVENTRDLTAANSLAEPVVETVGPGEPILYRWLDHSTGTPARPTYRESQYYIYWAAPPYCNRPRHPIHVMIGLAGAKPGPKMRLRGRIRDMYYSELLGGSHPHEWQGFDRVVTILCEAQHDGKGYRPAYNTLRADSASKPEPYMTRLRTLIRPWAEKLTKRAPAR